ncbi:hypothetical protein [Streptomyces sp. NPDC006640]|uniref:hypothetical protein n=1 Tax=unclassified Streptomyces TaxID=2593676 RepID=UPI0036B06849
MRDARKVAGYTTRDLSGHFSTGRISSVERGIEPASERMVDFYVTTFKADGAALWEAYYEMRLAQFARDGRRTSRIRRVPRQRRTTQSLVIESRVETHWINDQGVTTQVGVDLQIEPARPALKVSYFYPADPSPGTVAVSAREGCEVTELEESRRGLVVALLNLDTKPQNRPQAFSYRAHVNSVAPAVPYIRYQALRPTERYTLQVQFTSPRLPRQVWWFRSESADEAERDPEKKNVFPPSTRNDYFKNFRGLDREFCGIAWDW